MNENICNLAISQIRSLLRKRELSSLELTKYYLNNIERAKTLNAYSFVSEELAISQANEADKKMASAEVEDLCGIPFGIKDIFCTKGFPTQAASKILDGFIPDYESTVTENLFRSGAVMLGKTNMDEFAMGSSNETSHYGPSINPWSSELTKALVPGGSSGGSAAAVSADLCAASLGTDTGGSIRQPASFTGIVGLKPTYGRCSRYGIIAFASSLDQAGPMTKTVRDAAIVLKTISGHDPKDSTSAKINKPDFEADIGKSIKGKKIGIPHEYKTEEMPQEIQDLWDKGKNVLESAGAELIDVSLPHTQYALPAYYVIAPAEASSNLARFDGVKYGYRAQISPGDNLIDLYEKTRSEGFGDEVKRRLLIGTFVLSTGFYDAYYIKAQQVRTLIKEDFENLYKEGIEALLTPTTPSSAFPIGKKDEMSPVEMYLNDIFTVPTNLAGLPAISLPAGLNKQGLPLGLQLIGRPWEEANILNLAHVMEDNLEFSQNPKKWWT